MRIWLARSFPIRVNHLGNKKWIMHVLTVITNICAVLEMEGGKETDGLNNM